MWDKIIGSFTEYIGNGLAAGLFALAFVYLLFTEKDKTKRIVLLYVSFAAMALFFCPLFAKVLFDMIDDEIYYRILWLVPMTVVIAYAGVRLLNKAVRMRTKAIAFVLCCLLIAGTGDYVYDNPGFSPAENRFHVPQTVVLVCDAIIVEGWQVKAVFPMEMLPYVRQYTAAVCMPYGREMIVERWSNSDPLYDAMQADEVDCATVANLAAERGCHYIILHETRPLIGTFEGNGYHYKETAAGFCIYLTDDIPQWFPAD